MATHAESVEFPSTQAVLPPLEGSEREFATLKALFSAMVGVRLRRIGRRLRSPPLVQNEVASKLARCPFASFVTMRAEPGKTRVFTFGTSDVESDVSPGLTRPSRRFSLC